MRRIEEFGSRVYLVNTGWTGGPYGGGGTRFSIPVTRAVVTAIQSGALANTETVHLDGLNMAIPTQVEGVDSKLLNPRDTWEDQAAYDQQAADLIGQFRDNFSKFTSMAEEILAAGPQQK